MAFTTPVGFTDAAEPTKKLDVLSIICAYLSSMKVPKTFD